MNNFLLAIAVKGTVVLACCGLAALALRRTSAATRHLVWVAGICALLALPGLSLLAPGWAPPLPQAIEAAGAATRTVVDVTAEATPGSFEPSKVIPAAWGAITALLLTRLLILHRRTLSLARLGEAWRTMGGVEVKFSAEVDVPAVCGVTKPAVLLPAAAVNWPDERLEFVLRHEASHARRRDTLTQFLADRCLLAVALGLGRSLARAPGGRTGLRRRRAAFWWPPFRLRRPPD